MLLDLKVLNDKDQREASSLEAEGREARQGGCNLRAVLPLALDTPLPNPRPCPHCPALARAGDADAPLWPPRLGGLPQQVQQRVLHGPRVPRQVPLRGHHRGLLQPEAGPRPQPPPRIRHRPVSATGAGPLHTPMPISLSQLGHGWASRGDPSSSVTRVLLAVYYFPAECRPSRLHWGLFTCK